MDNQASSESSNKARPIVKGASKTPPPSRSEVPLKSAKFRKRYSDGDIQLGRLEVVRDDPNNGMPFAIVRPRRIVQDHFSIEIEDEHQPETNDDFPKISQLLDEVNEDISVASNEEASLLDVIVVPRNEEKKEDSSLLVVAPRILKKTTPRKMPAPAKDELLTPTKKKTFWDPVTRKIVERKPKKVPGALEEYPLEKIVVKKRNERFSKLPSVKIPIKGKSIEKVGVNNRPIKVVVTSPDGLIYADDDPLEGTSKQFQFVGDNDSSEWTDVDDESDQSSVLSKSSEEINKRPIEVRFDF
jgi:hypothetical protein